MSIQKTYYLFLDNMSQEVVNIFQLFICYSVSSQKSVRPRRGAAGLTHFVNNNTDTGQTEVLTKTRIFRVFFQEFSEFQPTKCGV